MNSSSNQKIVSILIPAYNVASYLKQCLDSVVNQTYQSLQVVVVDDGSTDSTLEIARQYADKYSFVEVYHQENSGVATTRNMLLSYAKGDYILFVDSDDWIDLNMIEQMLKALNESIADIVVCGNYKEQQGKNTIICPVVEENRLLQGTENVIKAFLFHKELNGSLWNKIVPRRYYERLSFREDIWYGEDCLFFWQALNNGVEKIYFIPDCYYHYRMNEQSISHEKFNHKKMTGHEVWKIIYENTKVQWPNLETIALSSYAISDMWQLYYAALSDYPLDEYLNCYQKNLRMNLTIIIKSNLLSMKKIFFASLISYNYRFSSFMLRKIFKI